MPLRLRSQKQYAYVLSLGNSDLYGIRNHSFGQCRKTLSLILTKHYDVKMCDSVEVQLHSFLSSALDRSEWLASCFVCFTPLESAAGSHWRRDWMGPTASLDMITKRKTSFPCQESNPSCAASSLITILTELPGCSFSKKVSQVDRLVAHKQVLSAPYQ